jgi:hypothetical protein
LNEQSKKGSSETEKNQIKLHNKKYDPFIFFLEEFKQHNPSTREQDFEKEAREQWMSLDKETRKIYNMHADREKKLQKQKKRKSKAATKDISNRCRDDDKSDYQSDRSQEKFNLNLNN